MIEIERMSGEQLSRALSPAVEDVIEKEIEGNINGQLNLRPHSFSEFPGQGLLKKNLQIYISAALSRKQPLDHVIFHGPPGLGKTTLAYILAHEMGVMFQATSGPALNNSGDMVGILSGLQPHGILFIDEIHRIPIQVEEMLYSAMEDFRIDIIVGQGTASRAVPVSLPPFTLVGATTKLSNLSRPFLNRFGIQEKLEFYDIDALVEILMRSAQKLKACLVIEAAWELAKRARGTPRIANRFLRRVSDFAQVLNKGEINLAMVHYALEHLDVDTNGLDRTDRMILQALLEKYQGGPVGLEALAVTLGEEKATLEDVYEPYLIYSGFMMRSPRGRLLTQKGRDIVTSH